MLLMETRQTLSLSQEGLGKLLGMAKRTIQRWEARGTILMASQIRTLATAVHPRDPDLAARIAAHGRTTLEALGLVKPPAPPDAPVGALPTAPPGLPPLPTVTLVDSIVCVAADAIGVLPRVIRPALAAAFVRAREVRLDVAAVADSLTGADGPGQKSSKLTSRAASPRSP
jgi:hypothetical protein